MNEDARKESTLGKAIGTAAIVGIGGYGIHKGITSDKAYNWASANQHRFSVADNILKYNKRADDFKRQYSNYRDLHRNNHNFVNADWEVRTDGPKASSASSSHYKKPKGYLSEPDWSFYKPKETNLLEAPKLSPEALKNQQNLDNLMSGMHNRRAGKIISDLTGKKRTKVSGRMINKVKAVTKAL